MHWSLRSNASGSVKGFRPKADFGGQEAQPDISCAEVLFAAKLVFAKRRATYAASASIKTEVGLAGI